MLIHNDNILQAIVLPDYLNKTDLQVWTEYLQSKDLAILPLAIQSISQTYNLPTIITNLTDPKLFKYSLYDADITGNSTGLTLDAQTLAGIYTGNINDWTDYRISQYTPCM